MQIIRTQPAAVFLLSLLLVGVAGAESTTRKSTSIINGQVIESEYPAFQESGEADTPKARRKDRAVLNFGHGLWIYDLLIDLTIDNDADGHYSAFSITLDIDNSFSPRDVYAVFYLSQDNGPWFEYAVTGNFTVSGNSTNDSISIDTSLDTGYPSDYYDLYAEIYDAHTGALLVTYGPNQSGHVIGIPFESAYNDRFNSSVSVQLSFSGSGSLSWFTLLFFVCLVAYRGLRNSGITTKSLRTAKRFRQR